MAKKIPAIISDNIKGEFDGEYVKYTNIKSRVLVKFNGSDLESLTPLDRDGDLNILDQDLVFFAKNNIKYKLITTVFANDASVSLVLKLEL